MKTTKQAMEFQKAQGIITEQTRKVAGGNTELAEVLKGNIDVTEAVLLAKLDPSILPTTMVLIEMEDEESAVEGGLAKLSDRFDTLMETFTTFAKSGKLPAADDAAGGDGGDDPDAAEALTLQKATGIAFALAAELLTGYISKLSVLLAKLDASDGTVTKQEVWDAFDGKWQVEEAVIAASIAVSKSEEGEDVLTKAAELFKAEMAKFETGDDDTSDDDTSDDDDTSSDDDTSDDDDTGDDDPNGNDMDLSPPLTDDN